MSGLVNTRCSRCGDFATDHDVDDEELRGCRLCECDQYEAPTMSMVVGEPGSPEWWRSPGFVLQGPADTILRLLEQEEISRRKALELLAYLYVGAPQDANHAPPPAPWAKLNWCDERPSDLTVRAACRQRMPIDGSDAQALEHALNEIKRMCGGDEDVPRKAVEQVIRERDGLRDWKAGATGAATIAYPPRTGPHTEEAYCAHKAAYEGSPSTAEYCLGADVVAAAVLAAKGTPCAETGRVGGPGVRDPEFPCADYEPGERRPGADCETDGHYLCPNCRHAKENME